MANRPVIFDIMLGADEEKIAELRVCTDNSSIAKLTATAILDGNEDFKLANARPEPAPATFDRDRATPYLYQRFSNVTEQENFQQHFVAMMHLVSQLLTRQEKIQAIKELRSYTGLGLKDAKEFVEASIPWGSYR